MDVRMALAMMDAVDARMLQAPAVRQPVAAVMVHATVTITVRQAFVPVPAVPTRAATAMQDVVTVAALHRRHRHAAMAAAAPAVPTRAALAAAVASVVGHPTAHRHVAVAAEVVAAVADADSS